jgi:hypothetical protein
MPSLIEELFDILAEAKGTSKPKKVTKKAAKSVYRRDYLRTRNKPYRKYEPEPTPQE